MKKHLFFLIVVGLLLLSAQGASAFNTSLNSTTKMLEIRNDDGSINKTIFPVGMYGMCNVFINSTCNPSLNPEFDFNIGNQFYGNANYNATIPIFEQNKVGTHILATSLPLANATIQASPYIYGTIHYSSTCTDEPDYSNSTCKSITAGDWNKSKQYYPNKLVYLNNWKNIIEWLTGNYTDIIGLDAYINNNNSVPSVYSRSDMIYAQEVRIGNDNGVNGRAWNDTVLNNKSVWLVINSNAISGADGLFSITENEARGLSFLAIASGVQGIAYYGYIVYPDNGLVHNNTIRQWYGNLKNEISSLNNILIMPTKSIFWMDDKNTSYTNITPNPTKTVYSGERNKFTYILKQPNTSVSYLIAVNKDVNSSGEVQINIGGMTGTQNVTFLGNATSGSGEATSNNASQIITATNGVFNDTFDGYAVHIYQISNATAGEGSSSSTSWIVNSSNWVGNSTNDNVTEDLGSHGIKIGLFADNFDDGNFAWSQAGNTLGTWAVSGGKLTQTGSLSIYNEIYPNSTNFTNMDVQAKINMTVDGGANDETGLVVHRTGNGIYAGATTNFDTLRIRWENAPPHGTRINLNTSSRVMNLNVVYNFRFQVYNGALKFKMWNITEPAWSNEVTNSTYTFGSPGVYNTLNTINVDDFIVRGFDNSGNIITKGNLTTWHNWTDGNVTHQVVVNATTPANTNYSVNLYNNVTGAFIESLGTALTGNQTLTIVNPVQDSRVNVTLRGNDTATPEILAITYYSQGTTTVQLSCVDNQIRWGDANTNYGTFENISVKARTSQNIRSLIECDLSSIPANANINNASLALYFYGNDSTDTTGRTYNIYPVWSNRTWGENTSNWNNYTTDTAWTASGGDYNTTPISQLTVPTVFGYMNWTITQLVSNAKNNNINASMILRDNDEGGVATKQAYFYSKDSSNTSLRPVFSVTYSFAAVEEAVSSIRIRRNIWYE